MLLQHVHLADAAKLKPLLREVQRVGVGLDDVLRGVDLRLQGRLGDRRVDDVGGERQVGRLQFETLILGLGVQLLDLPPDAAERVQRVGDVHGGGIQRVGRRSVAEPERGEGFAGALRLDAAR